MDKQAEPGFDNSLTRLPIPLVGDVNNRRFVTAVLAGLIGGAGVSSAANLLRSFSEMRRKKKDETNEDTIVLTLPKKEAADGYSGMKDAKPGETKILANGGRQFREGGRYGKSVSKPKDDKPETKCAAGNPGPNTVGTVVANALGFTAGGILSYEVVSRIFDRMQERRLKRKLEAAQQAYVSALNGASKRAEQVMSVIGPVERTICKSQEKTAGILPDAVPDTAANMLRYPAAFYILALLAGTGATAYVTKKFMDREFPEEKLKKDVNRPTRIVFRTEGGAPALAEGDVGKEKRASAETCAALTAMIPIFMDVVEGHPSRTLADPYVKFAESVGTDAPGLMKKAQGEMMAVVRALLSDPASLWAIFKGTRFGTDFSMRNAANALKASRPETYRKAVDGAIDAHFASNPGYGFKHWWAKNMTSRDSIVDDWLKKASVDDVLSLDTLVSALGGSGGGETETATTDDEKNVAAKARRSLKGSRDVRIEAADKASARYVKANKALIRRLLARLNAQGAI